MQKLRPECRHAAGPTRAFRPEARNGRGSIHREARDGKTVIAGYHWFSDWGRDTMIALPGLALARGATTRRAAFSARLRGSVDQGMLPNRFPDAGETPEYNTVDATLWFFEAVRALVAYTGDNDFVRASLYDVLEDIIAWHERGTRYGIRVDADGLLLRRRARRAAHLDGREGRRLGRDSALRQARRDPGALVQRAARHGGTARRSTANDRAHSGTGRPRATEFRRLFWNEAAGCLYDVVNGETRDGSIRPNQIFAVSLLPPMLAARKGEKRRRSSRARPPDAVRPAQPRPSDPQYRARYEGDP